MKITQRCDESSCQILKVVFNRMDIDIDSDIDSYNDNAPRLEDGSSINLPMAVTKVFLKTDPKRFVLKTRCRGSLATTADPSRSA